MATKNTGANTLKVGSYIVLQEAACKVTNIQISRPGKHGHAKMRVEAVGIVDRKKRIEVLPGHDNVEVPIIEKKTAQILSITEDIANVMDEETYETFDMAIPEEIKEEVKEGANVIYWQVLQDRVMKQVKSE